MSGKSPLSPDHDVAALANNMSQPAWMADEKGEIFWYTLNSIADAVAFTDAFGNINFLNLVAQKMSGWTSEEAAGRPSSEVFRIIDSATRQPVPDPMRKAVKQDKPVELYADRVLVRRDGVEYPIESSGAPIHDRAGRIIGTVIVFHDVSAARAISIQMTHAAQHDAVTGLPNRVLLNDRITQAIALARRNKNSLAVMFLDLDHFKNINDSLGHAIGDNLLQSVSRRLLASVRKSDTVSRMGGDEFVILLAETSNRQDAATSAK